MKEYLFSVLPGKTYPIWLRAYEILGGEYNEDFQSLIPWLRDQQSIHSLYLLEARKKPTTKSVQALISKLINHNNDNLESSAKRIWVLRQVVIVGNEQAIWELDIPYLPVVAPREKGRFQPKRFKNIGLFNIWKECLEGSLPSKSSLTDESKIGQVILSSVLFGGLLNSHLLGGLLKTFPAKPRLFNDRAYIDLSLSWMGHEDSESRRWFLDPLSETLIWQLRVANLDVQNLKLSDITKLIFIYLLSFFKETGLGKNNHPKNISFFLDTCSLTYDLMLPPFLSHYLQRKHISHSIKKQGWDRLEGITPSLDAKLIASGLDLEHWKSSPALTDKDIASEKTAESPYLTCIQKISIDLSNTEMRADLRALSESYENSESLQPLLFNWGVSLLEKGKKGRPAPKPNTVRQYIKTIGNRLYEQLGDIRCIDLDSSFIEDAYIQVLDDIDSKGLRRKVSRLLYSFHCYIVRHYDVVAIDYRAVLGDMHAPSPVDANLFFIDEFKKLLSVLDESDLILNHPKLVTATKILAILGYKCGLRRSEALKLRLIDFHGTYSPMLLVRPHVGRRLKTFASKRVLPLKVLLEKDELEFLQNWLEARKTEELENPFSPYLFSIPEKNYACISEDLVFPALHAAMRASTGDESIRYHHFRHSFASLTLLRLMVADYGLPEGFFDNQPETLKWLQKSKAFKVALYGCEDPTRKHLFYVSSLLGHSLPDVSLEHYIHTLDIISSSIIRQRFKPSLQALRSASGLPVSTSYRLSESGPEKLMVKIRKVNGFQAIKNKSVKNNGAVSKEDVNQGAKQLKDIWTLLYLYSLKGVEKSLLCERFSINDQEFYRLIAHAENLQDYRSKDRLKSPKFKMMEAKSSKGEYGLSLIPKRPRGKNDIAMSERLANAIYGLKVSHPEGYQSLIDLYLSHAWSTRHFVVFKSASSAEVFIDLLINLDVPKAWISCTVITGQKSDKRVLRIPVIPITRSGFIRSPA
ncbi:MAG: site-specific integrase, partial [Cycloclasticus sp.]